MTKRTVLTIFCIIFLLTVCARSQDHYYSMSLNQLQHAVEKGELEQYHGYVIEKTSEGGSQYDDYYIVNIDGELYEVEADDLEVGDIVTVYFKGSETVRTLYGWK